MEPFVGRNEALHQVRNLLRRTRREGFLFALVTGAPGVGKTRFLLEVQRRFRHRTFALYLRHVLDAQTLFQQLGELYPEQLLHLPRYCPADELEQILHRFPFLQPYVPVELPGGEKAKGPVPLYPCLQGLSKVRPLLLLLDDMAPLGQQHDLRLLLQQMARTPGLALVVSQDPSWRTWSQERITLPPLSLQETARFLQHEGLEVSEQALRRWHEATGGFPLLLHLALRQGSHPPAASWLHEHLRTRLEEQVRPLALESRDILALMSLLNTPVPLVFVQALAPRSLEAALAPAEHLGLLTRDAHRLYPPPPTVVPHLRHLLATPETRVRILRTLLPSILASEGLRSLPWHQVLLPPPEGLAPETPEEVTLWLDQGRALIRQADRRSAADLLHWLWYHLPADLPPDLRVEVGWEYASLLAFHDPEHPEIARLARALEPLSPRHIFRIHGTLFGRWVMAWDERKARRAVQTIERLAQSPRERDFAHLYRLLYRLHFRKHREPIYRELRQFIETTAFLDLRQRALENAITLRMCSQETLKAWELVSWYRQRFPEEEILLSTRLYLQSVVIDAGRLREARATLEDIARQGGEDLRINLLSWQFLWLWLLSAEGNHQEFERYFRYLLRQNERYPIDSMLHSITIVAASHYRELPNLEAYREQVQRLTQIRVATCARPESDAFATDLEVAHLRWMEQRYDEARDRLEALRRRLRDSMVVDRAAFYRLEGFLEWHEGHRRKARQAWRRCIQLLETHEHRMGLLWTYRSLALLTGEERYREKWRALALETGALGWYEDPKSLMLQALKGGERGRLTTLGTAELRLPGWPQPLQERDFRYRRAWLLLGLLVARGASQGLARQEVLARLWPEATSTNPLDIVLSHLRKRTLPALVETHEGRLRLNPLLVEVDAWAFEQGVRKGLAAGDPTEAEDHLEQAVQLYQGPFLPGMDHPDLEFYRQHLARLHREARLRLGLLALQRLAPRVAYEHAYRLISDDPYDEAGHRLMILSLWQQGHRSGALRHYEKLRTLLERDFGVSPSRELQQLVQRLREGAPLSFS